MSESFYASIRIGGQLKRSNLPQFMKILEEECLIDNQQEDLNKRVSDGILFFEDDEACNGQFESLEDLCEKLGLQYIRYSNTFCEFDAEKVWIDGAGRKTAQTYDNEDNPTIYYRTIRETIEAMDNLRTMEDVALKSTTGNDMEIPMAKEFLNRGTIPDPIKYLLELFDKINPKEPTLPPFEIID